MAPNSKNNRDSETSKILLMLKLNANRVYNRIDLRMPEYLDDFAMKRTRKYFPEVFNHKFNEVQLETLAKADTETIIALENYFNKVEQINNNHKFVLLSARAWLLNPCSTGTLRN